MDDPAGRLPEALADILVSTARTAFTAVDEAGLLERLDDVVALAPGVTLIPAPGHTPGHLLVEVRDSDPPLLYGADALLHELQFTHPDWTSIVDLDPTATVASRRAALDRACDTGVAFSGFHLGRIGRVTRADSGYGFNQLG
jgi:glyoxylase-like metal-dependent hydrolase (beta-lactamase superfamily II)